MSSISALSRKRGGLKHSLTCFADYLGNVQRNPNALVASEMQLRLEKLAEVMLHFETIQDEMEGLSTDDDINTHYQYREEFQSQYFRVVGEARTLLQPVLPPQTTPVARIDTIDTNRYNNVKLPTIELPKFVGRFDEWLHFKDHFDSLIHTNNTLSTIQKFHYLRSCLEGQARHIIQSLEFTENNYQLAYSQLCERYSNTKILVRDHINSLFNLPYAKETSRDIRKVIDLILKHVQALQTLQQPIEHWYTIIITVATEKLDKLIVKDWEQSSGNQFPKLEEFISFLQSRATLLETVEIRDKTKPDQATSKSVSKRQAFHASPISCYFCKDKHTIYTCSQFLKLSIPVRTEKARSLNLCLNCFKPDHFAKDCPSRHCKYCTSKHNSLIHPKEVNSTEGQTNSETPKLEVSSNLAQGQDQGHVLLSTVYITVTGLGNDSFNCHALLDSGSESNFISQELAEKLGVPQTKTNMCLVGINAKQSIIKKQCSITIHSKVTKFRSNIQCYILSSLCNNLPACDLVKADFDIPDNIPLANPQFYKSNKIDLIIGAPLFWAIMQNGQISLGRNNPVLHNTKLGWVISGITLKSPLTVRHCNFAVTNEILNDQLRTFWDVEEVPVTGKISGDEAECNRHFEVSHSRDNHGRFIVRIPFVRSPDTLRSTYTLAIKRLQSIERRFHTNSRFKALYVTFMNTYEQLNHMVKMNEPIDFTHQYLLPHHGVLREQSSTTKLRVVFDGSAQNNSSPSFNSCQAVGPVVQDELLSILLRFRIHKYVVSADIQQMYRQIQVHPDDAKFQRILWRTSESDPVEVYQLNTVTYGTASAPFLATRCLMQMAIDNEQEFPSASTAIRHDFYVDDLLTGNDSIDHLITTCHEIKSILKSAQFPLQKWSSNSPILMKAIAPLGNSQECNLLKKSSESKTLGVVWSPSSDTLSYQIAHPISSITCPRTKRAILSSIAQTFDPLGLLSPTVIKAKIFMQKLWELKLDWDDEIPHSLHQEWSQHTLGLPELNHLSIPRRVISDQVELLEYHGFCDASRYAYGACIYLRSIGQGGQVNAQLVCAKSRVAPVREMSIPRLELCGALLLSTLMQRVIKDLKLDKKCYYWCDSQIVLHWINTSARALQPFVSHRVAQIQSMTNQDQWYYVNTKDNPADYVSRGVPAPKLMNLTVWWSGPDLLYQSINSDKFTPFFDHSELPETKVIKCQVAAISKSEPYELFIKFSSWWKLLRVTAWLLRFKHNCTNKDQTKRQIGPLTILEINQAMKMLVRKSQEETFTSEIQSLQDSMELNKSDRLRALAPFLDPDGLLRVGGRLQLSTFAYDKKFPLLISNRHPLARLILDNEHKKLFHAGPQQMIAASREQFWIPAAKSLAKSIIRQCVICFKFKPKSEAPKMGSLPFCRTNAMYPFHTVGIDYAGPFSILDKRGRGSRQTKCYICLFVCMATRCIHLEAVSDLTTENFISSLRRFCSRRGKPHHIYSDNGRNFVGAARELDTLGQFLMTNKETIINQSAGMSIQWHFIPPYSPHMGGIWEANIKSTKFHLKRVLTDTRLIYEEFTTVLIQIEAILNSRPISQLSPNPNDLSVLTPSHLLIGRSHTSIADPDVSMIKINRLSRYQYLQRLQQQFWQRWRTDYIHQLQSRTKWQQDSPDMRKGAIVLLRDDSSPPGSWPIGRIQDLHPGADGTVRVASVKTLSGVTKRAVHKLCVLPIADNVDV